MDYQVLEKPILQKKYQKKLKIFFLIKKLKF